MAVAIVFNSLAIETQRNHKLRACVVKLYENDGTLSVAFFIYTAVSTKVVPQKYKSVRDNVDWHHV